MVRCPKTCKHVRRSQNKASRHRLGAFVLAFSPAVLSPATPSRNSLRRPKGGTDGENCFCKSPQLDASAANLLLQGVADKSFYAARLEVCRMVRCPKTCKHVRGSHANRRAFFVGSPCCTRPTTLALCRLQREARLTGRMRFCFAKFGLSDRKHFSSTWLACETSLLISGCRW